MHFSRHGPPDPSDSPLLLSLLPCGSAMLWWLTAFAPLEMWLPQPLGVWRGSDLCVFWTEAQRSRGREVVQRGHVPPLHYSPLPGSQGCKAWCLGGNHGDETGDRELQKKGLPDRPNSAPPSAVTAIHPWRGFSENGCRMQQSSCKPLTSLLFLGAKSRSLGMVFFG